MSQDFDKALRVIDETRHYVHEHMKQGNILDALQLLVTCELAAKKAREELLKSAEVGATNRNFLARYD